MNILPKLAIPSEVEVTIQRFHLQLLSLDPKFGLDFIFLLYVVVKGPKKARDGCLRDWSIQGRLRRTFLVLPFPQYLFLAMKEMNL